jgi:transcriptional antiterminator
MERVKVILTFEKLKWLIEHKATGAPRELAKKLAVSERTVYRQLKEIQELYSIEITFSYLHNSYIIKERKKN